MHVLSTDAELLVHVHSSPYVQVCSLPLLSRAEVKCIVGCLSRLTRVMSNAYLIKMAAQVHIRVLVSTHHHHHHQWRLTLVLMGSAGEELSAPTLETFLPSPHPSTTGCLHIRRDWGTRKEKKKTLFCCLYNFYCTQRQTLWDKSAQSRIPSVLGLGLRRQGSKRRRLSARLPPPGAQSAVPGRDGGGGGKYSWV